uniref:Large ribosomal subunit protein uL10m n=1 Tax=Naja naja TaxID=35670 RepID=A0A8C7E658_NAJNA
AVGVKGCFKSVTHHWKPMHIMKEKLMAVTEHIPPKPLTSETYMNPPVILPKEETGYERLLWCQVKQIFLDNKMIIVCQYNYIPGNGNIFFIHIYMPPLSGDSGRLTIFGAQPNVLSNSLHSVVYNLLPLFVEHNFLFVSMETRAWETLHILKCVPQINMLGQGACINNVILTQQGFVNFAKLPSIITAQGESACFFSVMTSHTSRLLQRGSVHLCSLLVLYIQQQNEKVEEKLDGNISYTGSSLILQDPKNCPCRHTLYHLLY